MPIFFKYPNHKYGYNYHFYGTSVSLHTSYISPHTSLPVRPILYFKYGGRLMYYDAMPYTFGYLDAIFLFSRADAFFIYVPTEEQTSTNKIARWLETGSSLEHPPHHLVDNPDIALDNHHHLR